MTRPAIVQTTTWPEVASRRMRSDRIAAHARRTDADEPALGPRRRDPRHGRTRRSGPRPTDRQAPDPPSQGRPPASVRTIPPTTTPAMRARVLHQLDQAVTGGEPLVRQEFGEDAVPGGAEKHRLHAEQDEDGQGRQAARRSKVEHATIRRAAGPVRATSRPGSPCACPSGPRRPRPAARRASEAPSWRPGATAAPACIARSLAAEAIASEATILIQAPTMKAPKNSVTSSPRSGCPIGRCRVDQLALRRVRHEIVSSPRGRVPGRIVYPAGPRDGPMRR